MNRILLLLLFHITVVPVFCQSDQLTLQYGTGNHVLKEWKPGSNIKLKTTDKKTISGELQIQDSQFIRIQDTLIKTTDILRVCPPRWTDLGLVTAGTAASLFIDPFFGICAAAVISIRLVSSQKQTESKKYKIVTAGSSFQKAMDPIRYAFDSAISARKNYRLYRYPVMPYKTARRYLYNSHILVITKENEIFKGRLRMVDSSHIAVESDTIALTSIARLNNRIIDPERDTLIPSFCKWQKINQDAKTKYWNYREQYLDIHPPGNYLYVGTDLLKYTVPKPNFTIDFYTRFHAGISAAAGWKPLNPGGNGFGFSWQSNVDFCSESKQIKINPFFWISPEKLHAGLRLGPYYYYKHLYADRISVADIHDSYIEYDLYWHDKRVEGLGMQLGIFHQHTTGLEIQLCTGYNHISVNDSIIDHSDVRLVNNQGWSFYADFSIIYSIRIKKPFAGRRED